ncbi:MAG: hypothetical protein QHC78_13930 [Pigmentiphaga sp.]|uniref:hypothetical protein n=1 Tax=Pigmentiphaga sp. TaxID=1977564 RepID=UPI0029B1A7AD|nr:hypothetical protein [Pigmentiphaga sp.]MDX3906780.1 hypothetical protein [Pigmentiphaga sp.]
MSRTPITNVIDLVRECVVFLLMAATLLLAWSMEAEAGTYKDAEGRAHDWSVTADHVMEWDGRPYVPFGGMFTSAWLTRPTVATFEQDRRSLQQIKAAGVEDLYLHVMNKGASPESTQRLIDEFERLGIKYGIQPAHTFTTVTEGYYINSKALATNIKNPGRVVVTLPGSIRLTSASSVRYFVFSRSNGELIDSGEVRPDGKRKLVVDLKNVPSGGARVKFLPEIRSGRWIDPNDATLINWVQDLRLGPGFRFFLDPFGNEYRRPANFLPKSSEWRKFFSSWLSQRYSTLEALNKAWGVSGDQLSSFESAAKLIPITVEAAATAEEEWGSALIDGETRIVRVDMRRSRVWLDMSEAIDENLQTLAQTAMQRLRQVVDVPIIAKRHHEATRIWISREESRGLDGLGMESYGSGKKLARFNGAATYVEALQSVRPTWLLVTEHNRDAWNGDYVGYRSRGDMYQHFNALLALGAKGIFVFGLNLKSSSGDSQWTTFDLSNDPRQLEWLGTFAKAARANLAWLKYKPKVAGVWYPVQSSDARSFLTESLPDYGLSGSWRGASGVVENSAGEWVVPVFYPDRFAQVFYSSALTQSPILGQEAAVLKAVGSKAKQGAGFKSQATRGISSSVGAAEALVKTSVQSVNGVAEIVRWDREDGREQVEVRSLVDRPLKIDIRASQPFVVIAGDEEHQGQSTSGGSYTLAAVESESKEFTLKNSAFSANRRFGQRVSVSGKPLILEGRGMNDLHISVR